MSIKEQQKKEMIEQEIKGLEEENENKNILFA